MKLGDVSGLEPEVSHGTQPDLPASQKAGISLSWKQKNYGTLWRTQLGRPNLFLIKLLLSPLFMGPWWCCGFHFLCSERSIMVEIHTLWRVNCMRWIIYLRFIFYMCFPKYFLQKGWLSIVFRIFSYLSNNYFGILPYWIPSLNCKILYDENQKSVVAGLCRKSMAQFVHKRQCIPLKNLWVCGLKINTLSIYSISTWTHVGMSDEAQESDFWWLNGAPLHYSPFYGGEPNNRRTENCIAIPPSLGWADATCSSSNRAFFCSSLGNNISYLLGVLESRRKTLKAWVNKSNLTLQIISTLSFLRELFYNN